MVGEPINFIEVISQQSPRLRGRNAETIEIYLLAAVIRSQFDQITLIGEYVIKFVLAEKAAKRRV